MVPSQKSLHSSSCMVGFSDILNYFIELLIDKRHLCRGFYENTKTDATFKKFLWNVISRSIDVCQAINCILIRKIVLKIALCGPSLSKDIQSGTYGLS